MSALKLFQVLGQIEKPEGKAIRIRLDGNEFDFGTPDYVMHQNDMVQDYSIKQNPDTFAPMVIASTVAKHEV